MTKPTLGQPDEQPERHDRACNGVECRLERLEYGRDKHLVWLVHALVRGFALLLPTIAEMHRFKEMEQEVREFQELIERACRGIDEDDTDYQFTG